MLTRSMAAKLTTASACECIFADFISQIEPKKVSEALKHPGWVNTMQEELNQFHRNKVWTLVPALKASTKGMVNPKESHLTAVKRIFRHMKGTPNLGLWYPKCSDFNLKSAKKQQSIAMSFDEVEYVAAARCCANILWMKSQLSDYDIKYKMDLGGNKSSTDQVNSNQQIIVFSLLTKTKIDIGEIIFHDLVARLIEDPRKKHMAYLRNPFEVTPVELTAYMLGVVEQETSVSPSLSHTDKAKTR
ncbi:hypothetical protein Tco_0720249, partial [Tanacetum coccineum]